MQNDFLSTFCGMDFQLDTQGPWYKSVNFGAGKSPCAPNWWAHQDPDRVRSRLCERARPGNLSLRLRVGADLPGRLLLREDFASSTRQRFASLTRIDDYSQVDTLGPRYKSVSLGAKMSPGAPNWWAYINRGLGLTCRFRRGLVFKAHRLLNHTTLGSRVIKKRRSEVDLQGRLAWRGFRQQCTSAACTARPVPASAFRVSD